MEIKYIDVEKWCKLEGNYPGDNSRPAQQNAAVGTNRVIVVLCLVLTPRNLFVVLTKISSGFCFEYPMAPEGMVFNSPPREATSSPQQNWIHFWSDGNRPGQDCRYWVLWLGVLLCGLLRDICILCRLHSNLQLTNKQSTFVICVCQSHPVSIWYSMLQAWALLIEHHLN